MNPSTGDVYKLDTYKDLRAAQSLILMGGELAEVEEAEITKLKTLDRAERERALLV